MVRLHAAGARGRSTSSSTASSRRSTRAASVKDRIGVAMIEAAEAEGRIEPGRTTIVEATSRQHRHRARVLCAAKGYDLTIFLPQGMSREREALLRLYGARVEMVESLGGMNEAVDAARAHGARPRRLPARPVLEPGEPRGAPHGTGPEILRALDGRVDVFVCGVGTGGTITGVGEALKANDPRRSWSAVEPAASAVLSGAAARSAPHPGHRRGLRAVGPEPRGRSTRCSRARTTRRSTTRTCCAAREGILAGMSCGAAVWAALEVAKRAGVARQADRHGAARTPASATSRRPSSLPTGTDRDGTLQPRMPARHASRSRARDPLRRRRRPRARPRRARRLVARDPAQLAGRPRAARPSRRRTRCTRRGVPLVPRAMALATRAITNIEIHPAATIGQGLFIDHGTGVVVGETAADRRQRDALPGRHARRHRLRDRQAPPDGGGQRDDRVGREAPRADHGRPRREDRRQQRRHHRRAAELDRRRQPRPRRPRRRPQARGARRRLDPPARPGRRRDPGALEPPRRARAPGRRARRTRELRPAHPARPPAEVRRLYPRRGPNPAGG